MIGGREVKILTTILLLTTMEKKYKLTTVKDPKWRGEGEYGV